MNLDSYMCCGFESECILRDDLSLHLWCPMCDEWRVKNTDDVFVSILAIIEDAGGNFGLPIQNSPETKVRERFSTTITINAVEKTAELREILPVLNSKQV